MKNIKKVLIILFLVVMISGCKVEYNLKINKDLSLNEKVTASENTDRMKSRTNLDVNQSVKYLYKLNKLGFMEDDAYSTSSSGKSTVVTVNNVYDNLEDYLHKFNNDLFVVTVSDMDKKNILLVIDQIEPINSKASNRYVYDQIDVTIEIPFEVIKSNADKVKGNKYTWYIKADSEEARSISVTFNGEKPKNTVTFNLFGKKSSIKYEMIIFAAVVLVIGIALAVLYFKNRKNNTM